MDPEAESRAEGGEGPGHARRTGSDPTLVTAAVFMLLGFTPDAWFRAALGMAHFGPLQFSAILAMVGVLFAVIAFLRGYDTGDAPLRRAAVVVFVVAMLRLFLGPLL